MSALTAVFLFQQRQFDSTTLLRSLAYSVALSIREAQTYGVSVRSFGATFPAYGVHFDINNNDQYILFADVDDDGQYVGDEATEFVDSYTFQGSYSLGEVCGSRVSPNDECVTSGLPWLAITFRRPNPEACIATALRNDICGSSPAPEYSEAYVQILGPGGASRSVTVTPSGQISVRALGT